MWILIDDAQKAYEEQFWGFWEALVKDLRSTLGAAAEKLRCVIAATYDLSTPESPVAFGSLEHVPERGTRITMTADEAEELFVERARDRDWATWADFKENAHTGQQRAHRRVHARSSHARGYEGGSATAPFHGGACIAPASWIQVL